MASLNPKSSFAYKRMRYLRKRISAILMRIALLALVGEFLFSASDMIPFGTSKYFTIRVIVFTFNRKTSLLRLLRSIESTLPPKDAKVSIHIMWDRDPDMSAYNRTEYYNTLLQFKSKYGRVHLHASKQQLGLKANILGAWTWPRKNEFAIFLEDDIEVSPLVLLFSEHIIQTYLLQTPPEQLLGVSLFHQLHNEVTGRSVNFPTNGDPFVYQQPQSWGALYAPRAWAQFLQYVKSFNDKDPLVPHSLANIWRSSHSWKKYMFRYMYEHGVYLIYTNFPNNLSLTTNHAEPGVNFATKPDETLINSMLRPPLVKNEGSIPSFLFPKVPLNNLSIYNIYDQRQYSMQSLIQGERRNEKFVLVTIVPPLFRYSHPHEDEFMHVFNLNAGLSLFKAMMIIEEVEPWRNLQNNLYQLMYPNADKDTNVTFKTVYNDTTLDGILQLINDEFSGEVVVLANSDIYFDVTLRCALALKDVPDAKIAFALSRHPTPFCPAKSSGNRDVSQGNVCENYVDLLAHDAFIFRAPLNISFTDLTFPYHAPGAANMFIKALKDGGYIVHNPCYDIHAFQIHCNPYERVPHENHLVMSRAQGSVLFGDLWTPAMVAFPKRYHFCKYYL